MALVRTEVGNVRALVAHQTPKILSQIEATLPVVNNMLLESENYSKQRHALLSQIARGC